MKVIHISYVDDGEGAAIAATRICEALIENNIDSKIIVKRKISGKPFIIKNAKSLMRNVISWGLLGVDMLISRLVSKDRSTYFSIPLFSSFDLNNEVRNADIIHLHWVNRGYLNLIDLYKLSKLKKPIVITQHDNWYFTGGCHMIGSCVGFKTGCKSCPRSRVKVLVRLMASLKKYIFTKDKLYFFAAISEQMFKLAKESYILCNVQNTQIPNCVNIDIFKPLNKKFCREVLRLDSNKKIILFLISGDPRKGMDYVRQLICDPDCIKNDYLFLGYGSEVLPKSFHGYQNVEVVGRFRDSHSLAILYNSVDVLVSPALEEPFGLTHIEAMACGTPTIGFNHTGTASIIRHNQTGYLAEFGNIEDLKRGITAVFNNQNIMSQASRDTALHCFSYKKVGASLINLYKISKKTIEKKNDN
ncbi:glycosyltransferase [Zooshikella harenae]|uniref:Glycosyltransferase n=1 Tax=Zooshikella harenae TaxID=2827238 RepID=A0ABS5Z8J1_9GAMM|nr:glycosyltransferase [Zooshikella harenae]MBU2710376.1 glycosyltransferase [Zooshikella harenae]